MHAHSPSRRRWLTAVTGFPLVLAGCGTGSGPLSSEGSAVLADAPAYRVGDRWTYRIDQQFRAYPDSEETWEVTATGPDGLTVRVATRGNPVDVVRTERWPAPGLVAQGALLDVETRRFAQPLERFRFPLRAGERWNQWVDQTNDTQKTSGPINRFVSVLRTEPVTVPAGTFEAVRMTVIMRLDDETPFRYATEISNIVWYAPQVRGVVREQRRAQYREKGSGRDMFSNVPVQNEIVELLAFVPGR
jgi:hypothetical protein